MSSPAPYIGRFPTKEQNKGLYKSEQRMLCMRATSNQSEGGRGLVCIDREYISTLGNYMIRGNSTVTEVQTRQQIQPYLDLVRIDLFVQHTQAEGGLC